MIITTNQSNGSGKEISVMVNKTKRTFTLYDFRFKLVLTGDHAKDHYPMKIYDLIEEHANLPFGKVVHNINNPESKFWNEEFEAFENSISEDNLSRAGKNIYEAAIKMLCNII